LTNAAEIRRRLRGFADGAAAAIARRFFKTGPGEYGEGDLFLGIKVPVVRRLAREYRDVPLGVVEKLLCSGFHEERQLALFILTRKFAEADETGRGRIYKLYLGHTRHINNWDLVDASAEHIVGAYLAERSRKPLYRLARSPDVWERRIAILSTFHFIKKGEFAETLRIAGMLLEDGHDLIQKAVGWMLREVGKRDQAAEEEFLKKYYAKMPRTMLRYAIERFPERKRLAYLKGRI